MSTLFFRSRLSPLYLIASSLFLCASVFVWSGCDRTETVFVERPFYDSPPAAAVGFLGYDDQDVGLTVCGNCHVGQQAAWEGTAHAAAWEGLQASGHAQAFCENCHTAGPLGNPLTEAVGFAGTGDSRYHDVQCESCHGAGQQHVTNPDASQPIAAIGIGDLSDLANATSCAECHQGSHHPFAEEWAQSGHASVVGFAAARPECESCHRGQGALKSWGVKAEYAEKNSVDHLPITCAVCHDPHDATNEGQLRFPVESVSLEENLCAQCHNRRTVPDPSSSHGLAPHAPQAALLIGEGGWFPPGVQIEQGQIVASHGSVANRRLCASCHVSQFEVTDEVTGDFVFQATGHLFTAMPCVGPDGIPVTGDCELAEEARAYSGCATAGCHLTTTAAASAMIASSTSIEDRANELLAVLELVDPGLDESGGEIDAGDPTFTTAEGAFFNYNLATFGDDVYGSTAHNPFLTEALLIASIQVVEDTYGVSAASGIDYDVEMERILNAAPKDVIAIPQRTGEIRVQPISSRR